METLFHIFMAVVGFVTGYVIAPEKKPKENE